MAMGGLIALAATALAALLWQQRRASAPLLLAVGGLTQGSAMITAPITVQEAAGSQQLGAAAASVQLARSLGSALGAAVSGAVLSGLLSATDLDATALFADMIRHGPGVLDSLTPEPKFLVQSEIADAFRGVFVTVACFSGIIVACAATMPMRRP